MKIEKIETIPVSIPLDKFEDDMDKVMGKNFPSFFAEDLYSQNKYFLVKSNKGYFLSNVIVKIFTDEGIIGIGEGISNLTALSNLHLDLRDNKIGDSVVIGE